MPSNFLDSTLANNRPSSLDIGATFVEKRSAQRLHLARVNQPIPTNFQGNSELQKQYSFSLDREPSIAQEKQSDFVSNLPPLRPHIQTYQEQHQEPSNLEYQFTESTETMTGTERTFAQMATLNANKTKVQLTVENWKTVLEEIRSLRKDNSALTKDVRTLTRNNSKFEEELADKNNQIARLKQKKGKSKERGRKDEQNDDVNEAITVFIKDVLFRTVKFAPPGTALDRACTMVWNGIKDNMKLETGPTPLDLPNFAEIYDSKILEVLSERRQYIATRCQAAAKSWYDDHGNLPTINDMENIYKVGLAPPEDATEQEKAKFVRHEAMLTWYLDEYLPMAAGNNYWGEGIRPFHFPTDKMEVPGDPSGEKKVLVTVTSEAFGLMLFANGRDKWIADWIYKKANKNKRVPSYNKDDATTHKYANKWSSSRTGQVQGGGWQTGAYNYLKKAVQIIKKVRANEESNGNLVFRYGQILIKRSRQIDLDQTEYRPTKKAKKASTTPETAVLEIDLDFEEE